MASGRETREAAAENTFVIGLAMAGAISAGAYTAGVLDTLFRALAEHERKFQNGEVDHRVVVKAMSGASAGSICAALTAASLVQGVRPLDIHDPFLPGLPLLHELWVDRIRLMDAAGDGLLGSGDVGTEEDGSDRPVTSLLDSSHIRAEAEDLVADVLRHPNGERLGYVAKELDLFLTTTNLMGVTYEVRFGGEDSYGHGHVMSSHGNVEHFRLHDVGEVDLRSEWLDRWSDRGIALHVPEEAGLRLDFGDLWGDEPPRPWARLVRSAVASGAFPGGLSSQRLDVSYNELNSRAWPIETDPHERRPRPRLPAGSASGATNIGYIAVDGGVANNEPFELARFAIRGRDPAKEGWALVPNPRDAAEAHRAVIMIDPFPEGPEMTLASEAGDVAGRRNESRALFAARRLLPSLINQARFKLTELLSATDTTVHSRFLVAPSRVSPDGSKLRGAMAIASGFVGGFGGFFNRVFREHDYRLGQHNCRSFLCKYFVLDGENRVFAGRNDLLAGVEPGMARILQVDDGALPDFVDENGFFYPRPVPKEWGKAERGDRWPGLSLDDFDTGRKAAEARIGRIATPLLGEIGITNKFKRMIASYLWAGLPWLGGGIRDALSVDLGNKIKGEMVARNQLLASRYFADPRDRALYAAIVRNGERRATMAELAAQSTIFVPEKDDPMKVLTLTEGDVAERVAAGQVKLRSAGPRWKLV